MHRFDVAYQDAFYILKSTTFLRDVPHVRSYNSLRDSPHSSGFHFDIYR